MRFGAFFFGGVEMSEDHISVGSANNPDQAADDARNREWFEEAMEIVRRALSSERFSFSGKYFQLPAPGIRDRGDTVHELTPRPAPPSTRTRSGRRSPVRPPSSTYRWSTTVRCSGTSTRRSSSACGAATAN